MFLLDAQALRMNAAVYESYANQFKAMAASYKSFANTYMSLANQFAGTAFSAVYKNLSNAYNTYSRNYANLANSYLNTAANYKNQVAIYSSYENYVSYYTDLANNAITEATAAQQVADQYSKKAEQGNIVNEAYQEILADSEYNYFYKVLKQDSFNRVTQYLSGNGLITTKEYDNAGALNHIATGYNFDDSIRDLNFEYDKVANVTKREDKKLGVTQTYQYDNLNRIVTANSFTQDNTTQMSYAYDSIGNMTYKSDIGDYNYNNQSPHQVTQAGEKNFEYDLNGNMTNNNGTLIEYTPFNKPSKLITQNDTVEFSYDTNKNRYKKSTDKYTSYYIDKSYEYKINKDNSVEHKYFIYEDSKVISIYTDSSSNISTKYLHYDSLNSVDTITNNLGVVEQRMAYKPFGEKLNLDKDGKESTTAPYTNRGYTGHEHIEETNLIHMNGRVCDPTIGRFTSADPYIQAPYNTQSFNRYSYVMNNPLKYVDPSGYYADISYGYSSYSSGFTISISGFTFGGYGYGYNDYFMQQQRAQIRAAQARANAQAVAAAWQRIFQAQAQTAAQTQAQAQAAAQASAQATAAQQTQLQQNLNYQSMSSNSSHLAAGGFIRFQPTNQVPDLDHHDILTAFSVIPVVGGIAGTIDALSYAYEGDYSTAATMLAVGFIPGGKLGMKVVGGGIKKTTKSSNDIYFKTSRQALRQAKRDAGIPTGQTHITHRKNVITDRLGGRGDDLIFENGQTIQHHRTGHNFDINPKPQHFNNHPNTKNHYIYE